MTDKTIERVAEGMLEVIRNSVDGHYYADDGVVAIIDCGDVEACIDTKELAKAAIEALGVIILPHDAEPEVGDLVMQHNAYDADYVFAVGTGTSGKFFEFKKDGTYNFFPSVKRIIQHNGKPVIQEAKPC